MGMTEERAREIIDACWTTQVQPWLRDNGSLPTFIVQTIRNEAITLAAFPDTTELAARAIYETTRYGCDAVIGVFDVLGAQAPEPGSLTEDQIRADFKAGKPGVERAVMILVMEPDGAHIGTFPFHRGEAGEVWCLPNIDYGAVRYEVNTDSEPLRAARAGFDAWQVLAPMSGAVAAVLGIPENQIPTRNEILAAKELQAHGIPVGLQPEPGMEELVEEAFRDAPGAMSGDQLIALLEDDGPDPNMN